MKKTLSLSVALAAILVAPAIVPEAEAQDPAPDYYGTASTNYHYISGEEFQTTADHNYSHTIDGFWTSGAMSMLIENMAPLRLPSGALVDGYTVVYDDLSVVNNLHVELNRYWVSALGTAGTTQIGPTFTSSGFPGITSTWVDLTDFTISYFNTGTLSTQSYAFTVILPGTQEVRFRGVIVHWKRQISPEPAVATFADVPVGAFGFRHIEALVASGITAGCGGGNFCPNNTLTRAEMAIFLAKALGLHWAP